MNNKDNTPMNALHPPELKRAQWLAKLLDSAVEIPGIKVRLGLDAVLGLVPGVGDGVAALLGLYPIYVAVQWGADKKIITRMLLNVAVDMLAGIIPVVGVTAPQKVIQS